MVEFKFSKAHGTAKKGETRVMFETTAKALELHEVGKITKELPAEDPKASKASGAITTASGK